MLIKELIRDNNASSDVYRITFKQKFIEAERKYSLKGGMFVEHMFDLNDIADIDLNIVDNFLMGGDFVMQLK